MAVVKLAVAAALVASAYAQAYELVDTQILGRDDVYWIDNSRVLFPGFANSSRTGQGSSSQSVLYVWDVNTKRLTTHDEIAQSGHVCYASGYVRYSVERNGRPYFREGRLGAEVEREALAPASGSRIDRNEFTCREMDLSAAEKLYPGFVFIPLRDGHGHYGWQRKPVAEAASSRCSSFPRERARSRSDCQSNPTKSEG
jgi:hypothetical protein